MHLIEVGRLVCLSAFVIYTGCTHLPDSEPQTPVSGVREVFPAQSVRLDGLWMKKRGYYALDASGSLSLRELMERSGGFEPFDKREKFPSCFYVIRPGQGFFQDEPNPPTKYFFDGRRCVREDGSVDPAGLPDIRLNDGETVWFDWVLW